MGVANARGRAGETLALAYLELCGFAVRARNVRLGGVEIDALAQDGPTQVIVEVKFRNRGDYGGAALAVDAAKRERLRRAALVVQRSGARRVRIDVVAVELSAEGATVCHYRDAIID